MEILGPALFIGYVWPEPQASAAGQRILELVDFFKAHASHVSFFSASQAHSSHRSALEEKGVETVH